MQGILISLRTLHVLLVGGEGLGSVEDIALAKTTLRIMTDAFILSGLVTIDFDEQVSIVAASLGDDGTVLELAEGFLLFLVFGRQSFAISLSIQRLLVLTSTTATTDHISLLGYRALTMSTLCQRSFMASVSSPVRWALI